MDAWIVLMRWLHVASVAVLAGGTLYGWAVVWPSLSSLSAEMKARAEAGMAARFRPFAMAAMAALAISGAYSLILTPGHTTRYLVVLAVKLLLVLHVFGVAFALATPASSPERVARRPRQLAGAAISAFVIIALSTYLRRIF